MKLSNKVLIGFFGFAFVYLTAVFAEVRLRGTPNIINDSNSIEETANIQGVAYLILRDLDENIDVVASDTPRLAVRSFSGNVLQRLKYNISGDTLTLSHLRSEDIKPIKVTIFLPATGLQGMTVDSAVAIIKGLNQERLQILQNAGRIWMSDSKINAVELEASHGSYSHISESELDTLSAKMEGSQVFIGSPVTLLKGSMKNNSFLQLIDSDEIQFKKDESSRLNWYQ